MKQIYNSSLTLKIMNRRFMQATSDALVVIPSFLEIETSKLAAGHFEQTSLKRRVLTFVASMITTPFSATF